MHLGAPLDMANPFESGMFSSVTLYSEAAEIAPSFTRSASEQVESMHAPHAHVTAMHPRPRHPSERSRVKSINAWQAPKTCFDSENMHAADGGLVGSHTNMHDADPFEAESFVQIGDDLQTMLSGAVLLSTAVMLCHAQHLQYDHWFIVWGC